jgi:hypothetical protein
MSSFFFDSALDDICRDNINLSSDSFFMLLVSAAPNRSTMLKRGDITSEITGTGYTTGGATCAIALTNNTTTHQETVTTASTSWAASTLAAVGAVVYKARGGLASADNLLAYLDFGATVTDTDGTFTVNSTVLTLQG